MKEAVANHKKTNKKANKKKSKVKSQKVVSKREKPVNNNNRKLVNNKKKSKPLEDCGSCFNKSEHKQPEPGEVQAESKPESKPELQLEVSKHGSVCPTEYMKEKVKRDFHGRILPGGGSNGGGRPKGTFRPSITKFSKNEITRKVREFEARQIVENSTKKKKHKKSVRYENWLEHQIKKSFDDTQIAIALLKMQFPTLKSVEAKINQHSELDDEKIAEIREKMEKRFSKNNNEDKSV